MEPLSVVDIVDLLQVVGGHTKVTVYAFCYLQGERDLGTEISLLVAIDVVQVLKRTDQALFEG